MNPAETINGWNSPGRPSGSPDLVDPAPLADPVAECARLRRLLSRAETEIRIMAAERDVLRGELRAARSGNTRIP